ncbi:MAG: hypothetical protein ACYTHM_05225 [Planctomycetota bacterium]|jgi:hypothetical protein
MFRWIPAALVLSLGLAVPLGLLAAEGDSQTITIPLSPTPLSITNHKNTLGGTYIASSSKEKPPPGFDSLFTGRFGAVRGKDNVLRGGIPFRFLHKGWEREKVRLFIQFTGGDPIPLFRLDRSLNQYYIPFGPARIEGLPPLTLHFYYPTRNVEAWKTRAMRIYALPMACRAGTATVNGQKIKIGLLDRNLNGSVGDPCVAHVRDGDWVLIDKNQDGAFDIDTHRGEAKPLTRCLHIAGKDWAVVCKGNQLTLSSAKITKVKLRLEGIANPCRIYAWSAETGSIQTQLDEDGCITLPKGKCSLYTYQWTKGEWRLTGSLRAVGVLDLKEGTANRLKVGPSLRATLSGRQGPTGFRFTFRCLGQAGESVTIYQGGRRVPPPTLVITDAKGEEVFRQAMRYG